jgi:aspartate kinase
VRIIVQKYGGSSVADLDRIRTVAQRVKDKQAQGYQLVVVVSAMGDTTDELLSLAKQASDDPPRRELDMLLTCGERISMALLSMALQRMGVPAISFTGSQSGIITDEAHAQARIVEVRPMRIQEELRAGRVVIVAGYQGVSRKREVTTLGRGGSDTTAVALAAALSAEACEIYSDVDGIFSADPRVVPDAHKLDAVSYEEMQELASAGARVLNAQAVEFAQRQGIVIQARSTLGEGTGTAIRHMAADPVPRAKAVASESELLLIRTGGGEALEALLRGMDARALRPRVIGGEGASGFAAVPLQDVHALAPLREALGPGVELVEGLGSVTAVGAGINADLSCVRSALGHARAVGARVQALHTSPLQLTLFVPREHLGALTQRLHAALVQGQVDLPAGSVSG